MTNQAQPQVQAAVKDISNNITRPASGATRRIWDIADSLSTQLGTHVDRKSVMAACTEEGINPSTTATQYGRWRKYYGLTAERAVAPAADKATPAIPPVQPKAPVVQEQNPDIQVDDE